jgi:hypothetical protein
VVVVRAPSYPTTVGPQLWSAARRRRVCRCESSSRGRGL